ncbi:MAG: hypothetical protein ABSH48_13420 [Verrucomicrobiota bacterium]|jgi:hypothetical protein
MTKADKFLGKVLRRMFRAVGRVYAPEFTRKPDWFRRSSWTVEQENDFKAYFVRQAMRDFGLYKRQAVKEAWWFLLFYGWKLKPFNVCSLKKKKRKKSAREGALIGTKGPKSRGARTNITKPL